MNIGRATEYINTSQLFIGINLLKIVGVVLGPQKNFSILSFEMLNFYSFWTLEQEIDYLYFQRRKKITDQAVGAPECGGPLCTAQPAQPIATPLLRNDLLCVERDVKLYSLTHSLTHSLSTRCKARLDYFHFTFTEKNCFKSQFELSRCRTKITRSSSQTKIHVWVDISSGLYLTDARPCAAVTNIEQ